MSVDDAVLFADAELAQGRLVVLELGPVATVVRIGREIRDAIARLWSAGRAVVLTTMPPMQGGQEDRDEEGPTTMAEDPGLRRMVGRYDVLASESEDGGVQRGQSGRRDPESDVVAWRALVAKIGSRPARALLAGGGYAVRSHLWPQHVLYIVTPEIIKVVNEGIYVSSICVVATDGGSRWDAVLNRISLLEAGADGEVQVYATGELRRR